jgi:hypothetical protein
MCPDIYKPEIIPWDGIPSKCIRFTPVDASTLRQPILFDNAINNFYIRNLKLL